jgi:hypothetical protein
MNTPPKKRGDAVDSLIANNRRLSIAHLFLGLATAVAYWVRPGTIAPNLKYFTSYGNLSPIYLTIVVWLPYIFSLMVSRPILVGCSQFAVFAFIVCATAITGGTIGVYLNLIPMKNIPSPVIVSAGVTIALIAAALICSAIWRRDVSDE